MGSALTAGLQCSSCEGDSLESVSKQSGMSALLPPLPLPLPPLPSRHHLEHFGH